MPFSSRVRSRISDCARLLSFQRLGSSTAAFSSARRRVALSQSKMPPQQRQRAPYLVARRLDLSAHVEPRSVFSNEISKIVVPAKAGTQGKRRDTATLDSGSPLRFGRKDGEAWCANRKTQYSPPVPPAGTAGRVLPGV